MLGRVRPSSSSLESLEMERDEPSKLTKHDSLSIYEATLVKLRQGAQRQVTTETEQEMKIDKESNFASDQPLEEMMVIEMHPSPCSVLSSPNEYCPMGSSSREQRGKTTTVISMFDRYKTSHCIVRAPDQTVTETKF